MNLYLDTDIFLALIKDDDHLKSAAKKFFEKEKPHHALYTSAATCLEIAFYLYKNKLAKSALDAINYVEDTVEEVMPLDNTHLKSSVLLASQYHLSPTDAIHAVYASNLDAIVSTDAAFDRVPGLKKLDFTK